MAYLPGPPRPPVPRPRYTGPPSYPTPPRWGFPVLAARRPTPTGTGTGTGTAPAPAHAVRVLAATLLPLLSATALVALVAAGAEAWRYELLLRSRNEALPLGQLLASDALVLTAGVLAPLVALAAGAVVLRWLLRASAVAGAQAGVEPSRRPWQVVVGAMVPGLNLAVPGAVLAEVEHAALGRPPAQRPAPSRLVRTWWVAWALNVVLGVVAVLHGFSAGVQARADGVVLHAVTDVVAAVTAVITLVVVRRLTALLQPVDPRRLARMAVLRVGPAADTLDR